MTEEPKRGRALLDLITNMEDLARTVKVTGNFAFNDCEMVEFRILRKENMANSRISVLDFRRVDFGLFKDLLGRIICNVTLKRKGDKEN